MKKNLLYFAALALTLGMASCSSDDTNFDEQATQDENPVEISLAPQHAPKVSVLSNNADLLNAGEQAFTSAATKDAVVITDEDGSVEVNLTLNDAKEFGDWKESHLSIHVRDTTNVTVFMPIDKMYYCQQDDMMIVKNHKNVVYKTDVEEVSTTVGGEKVTLTIRYRENGIEVSTVGINNIALKAMRKWYKDGITFEIKNYYRIDEGFSLTRDEIKSELDKSFITFDREPKFYVNAFGKRKDPVDPTKVTVDPLASTVKPQNMSVFNEPEIQDNASLLYIYAKK